MASAVETAARVRAARAWAGIEQRELASRLDMSPATLRRLEAGQRTATQAELEMIAKVTNAPVGFLENGFDAMPRHGGETSAQQFVGVLERNARLELEVERLQGLLEARARDESLADQVASLAATVERLQAAAEASKRDTRTALVEGMQSIPEPERSGAQQPRS